MASTRPKVVKTTQDAHSIPGTYGEVHDGVLCKAKPLPSALSSQDDGLLHLEIGILRKAFFLCVHHELHLKSWSALFYDQDGESFEVGIRSCKSLFFFGSHDTVDDHTPVSFQD